MTYDKTIWVDDIPGTQDGTVFTAARMNNIEDGIEAASIAAEELKGYDHIQSLPSAVWTIVHNLARWVEIELWDSAGSQVFADIDRVNDNTVVVTFIGATAGRAVLS